MQDLALMLNPQTYLENTLACLLHALTLLWLWMHGVVTEDVRQCSHKLDLRELLARAYTLSSRPGEKVWLSI